jgi:hypothetical protein
METHLPHSSYYTYRSDFVCLFTLQLLAALVSVSPMHNHWVDLCYQMRENAIRNGRFAVAVAGIGIQERAKHG